MVLSFLLKIFDPVIDYLDLLLNDRHSLGEVIVLSHFFRQLFDLGVGDGLPGRGLTRSLSVAAPVGYDDPDQSQNSHEDRGDVFSRHETTPMLTKLLIPPPPQP